MHARWYYELGGECVFRLFGLSSRNVGTKEEEINETLFKSVIEFKIEENVRRIGDDVDVLNDIDDEWSIQIDHFYLICRYYEVNVG
jgi:hypothetical protein